MKLHLGRLGAVALAGAAAAAVAVAMVPGTASAATGWRLAATFPKSGALGAASASSTSNEWVASAAGAALLLEHRTATGWQAIPLPDLGLAVGEKDTVAAVAAIPGGGAWAFVDVYSQAANGQVTSEPAIAVRWTGSSWSAPQAFAEDFVSTALALSPKDVWQFGVAPTSHVTIKDPGAWHYNGTSWSKVSVPWFVDAVSGSGSAGLWIIGRPVPSGSSVSVAHWAKGGWQQVPLPRSAAVGSFADGIVATGAKDVWASLERDPPFGPHTHGYLLHWNGSTWSSVSLPFTTTMPRQLASDGHGGLWLVPDLRFVYHYSGGHWSALIPIPVKAGYTSQVRQLVAVPASTSLLAAGDTVIKGQPANGAIFTYGP